MKFKRCTHAYKMLNRAENLSCEECLNKLLELAKQQGKQEMINEIEDSAITFLHLGWNDNKSCLTISKRTIEEIKKRHNLK
jgi:diphthamide biosynthesis methyltransferase